MSKFGGSKKSSGGGKKKVSRRVVSSGVAHITSTFNNIIVTIADMRGNALVSVSSGQCGCKGSKKATPYAGQVTAEKAARMSMELYGMESVSVSIKGPGNGRDSAVMALRAAGLKLVRLNDVTSLPHNGCRARKKRRV